MAKNEDPVIFGVWQHPSRSRKEEMRNGHVKINQVAPRLDSSRDSDRKRNILLQDGQETLRESTRTLGVNNSGLIGLQRQIMREQDEDLAKLEETALSTKHIALAVNEELDLHAKLLDELDQDVDVTNNRMKVVNRRLAFLSKKMSSNCSCISAVLMIFVIVLLVLAIFSILRYL